MKYDYRKRRFYKKHNKNIFVSTLCLLTVLILFSMSFMFKSGITGFTIYQWNSQTVFDSGTYNSTEFSIDHLQLSSGQSSGFYTSSIKDAGANAQWNNISWTEDVPYGEVLPANKAVETNPNGADMTGNVLLMYMNESSGTIIDYSGEGNNGMASGTSYGNAGKFGTALGFDGTDDYINVSYSSSLDLTNDLTIEMWIKPGSIQKQYADIMDKKHSPQTDESAWVIQQYSSETNKYCFAWYTDTWEGWSSDLGTQLAADTWQHFAIIKEGINVKTYVNGIEKVSFTAGNATIRTNNYSLTIGANAEGLDRYFNGIIDEVAIYNRTLTATEILNHYKRGALKLNVTVRSCDDSNCSGDDWNETFEKPSNLNVQNNRYFQYKANFYTENTTYSPILYNLAVDYNSIQDNAPIVTLNSPQNNTVSTGNLTFNCSASDDYGLVNISLYHNVNGWMLNQSSIVSGISNYSTFSLTNLLGGSYKWSCLAYDNNNNSTLANNYSFSVVLLSTFDGDTTNLNNQSITNIQNLTLEKTNYGKIIFSENIDLSAGADLNNYVNISYNRMIVNASVLPALNRSATIYLYNLTFSNPRILKNGVVCPETECVKISYSSGTLIYRINHFSDYVAEETPSSSSSAAPKPKEETIVYGGTKNSSANPNTTKIEQKTEIGVTQKTDSIETNVSKENTGEKKESNNFYLYIIIVCVVVIILAIIYLNRNRLKKNY